MKSVLFAVHTFYPDKNGVQNVTHYLATGLVAYGYSVSVVTELRAGLKEEEYIEDVHVYRINAHTTMLGYKGNRNEYINLIKKIKPDVFIPVCTQSWTLDWLPLDFTTLPGKKCLYTHGFSGLTMKLVIGDMNVIASLKTILAYLVFKIRWKFYYKNIYKVMRNFDVITYLCETDSAYKYARKHNLKNGVVIENAVEEALFDVPDKKSINLNQERPSIICISNYSTIKNQKMLIDAYSRIKSHANLILIGSKKTKYYSYLCEYSKKIVSLFPNKKIDLFVELTREETLRKLAESDIFATCSRWEAYPLVVFEAMALSLPVVATDVGNLSTIPGILIAKSVGEMTSLMESYCLDSDKRNKVGHTLREYAAVNNRIEKKIQQLEKLCKLK